MRVAALRIAARQGVVTRDRFVNPFAALYLILTLSSGICFSDQFLSASRLTSEQCNDMHSIGAVSTQ